MYRKTLTLILLALPLVAAAQSSMSNREYRHVVDCKRFADSASFVVAQAQAGSTDAQIQGDMFAYRMRPLDDHLRLVLEQNASAVTANEVLQVSFDNCMRGAQ